MAKRQVDAFRASRKKREEEKAKTRVGGRIGSWINQKQDAAMGIISPKAKKRAEKMRTGQNKTDIDEGAKDLIDKGATADSLAIDVNNTFLVTPSDRDRKGKIDQSKQAQAYLRQDSDDRKMHIQNTLVTSGGIIGSDVENVLNAPVPPSIAGTPAGAAYLAAQVQAQAAAGAIAGGSTSENDIRKVVAFVNQQMKRKVEMGANA